VQKDSRRHTLSSDSEDEDLPLQWRVQHLPDPDSDSEDDPSPFRTADAVAHYHSLQTVHLSDSDEPETSELTPEELVEAIIQSTCINTVDQWGDSALHMLLNNPDLVVLRTGTGTALVLFADGRHYVFLSADVDAAFRRLGSPSRTPPSYLCCSTERDRLSGYL
jgi:hypothetical protein